MDIALLYSGYCEYRPLLDYLIPPTIFIHVLNVICKTNKYFSAP